MMKRLFIFLLFASPCFGQALPANTPAFDPYGGFAAKPAAVQCMVSKTVAPQQLITTSSTPVTPGMTTTITLSSTTECGGQTLVAGEYLTIDAGNSSDQTVTGETPSTYASTGGTNASGLWFGDGTTTSFTAFLSHASVEQNTVQVFVAGAQVAVDIFGGIESGSPASWTSQVGETTPCSACTNLPGDVTGHVATDDRDSRAWISIQFLTAPANGAQITLSYKYLPPEVNQVAPGGVSGNNVTLVNPLYNAHSGTYKVTTAYFTVQEFGGTRWMDVDALGFAYLENNTEEWQSQGSFGDCGVSGCGASGPYIQNSVTTTTTQAITGSTTPQTVTVADNSNIVAGPGMILNVGRNPTGSVDNQEGVVVTSVGAGTITGIFKNNHLSGDTVECCQQSVLAAGGAFATGGTAPTGNNGKYLKSAFSAVNSAANQWQTFNKPAVKVFGFMGIAPAGSNSVFDTPITASGGAWDLPEGTSPFKDPFQYTTYECSDGLHNIHGFVSDIVLDGNPKPGHGQSGKVEDYLDPNLYLFAGAQMRYVLKESPWAVVIMPTQTDDCPTIAAGEHFQTTPSAGFQSSSTGKILLDAPPYMAVSFNVIKNKLANGAEPLSQRGTFETKAVGLPQYLQGTLDPINFPTAATGSNLTSISCSGSNAQATLSGTYLGTHLDPFTIGDVITVKATGFNTASGQPAMVITAAQGSHQITFMYPGTSPCPGATTQSSGLIAEGPGYQSITDLNTAWGATYTSFGSSGTLSTGNAVTCSGTPVSCSFSVTGPVDPLSLEVTASNGTISQLIAADFVTSTTNPPTAGSTGKIQTMAAQNKTTTQAITCASPPCSNVSVTLSNYTNIVPGMIFTITDGTNTDIVKISSVNQQVAANLNYSATVSGVTLNSISHGYASGVTFNQTFSCATPTGNTAFTYSTMTTASFCLDSLPPAGFTLTAQYHANGWANAGTGILDEDGRCAGTASSVSPFCTGGNAWAGNDNACTDTGTGSVGACNAAHPIFGTAAFQRDIHGFGQAAIAHYARGYKEQASLYLPHTMVIQSYRGSGMRGDPGRFENILGECISFEDICWGSFVERFDGGHTTAGAQFPCLTNSSGQCPWFTAATSATTNAWTLVNDPPSMTSADYMFSIMGDKPFHDFSETSADQDSDFECLWGIGTRFSGTLACVDKHSGQTDGFQNLATQAARATFMTTWLNTVFLTKTVNGTFQYEGNDWWAPIDTPLAGGQYDDYGYLTVDDNFKNGVEACNSGTQPTTQIRAGYPLTPVPDNPNAASCYGNFLGPWQTSLWNVFATITGAASSTPVSPGKKGMFAGIKLTTVTAQGEKR